MFPSYQETIPPTLAAASDSTPSSMRAFTGNQAAFFDVDKTLVRVNTGSLFVRRRLRNGDGSWLEFLKVTKWIIQYNFGFLDAGILTKKILQSLKGIEESAFRAFCHDLFVQDIRPRITDAARQEVAQRQREGHICAILSATTPYISEPVAKDLGIEHVLCTHLKVVDGRFSGEYEPPLCYGPGKVKAAEQWAKSHNVDLENSSFYSDSVTDLPMLERVGEPRVINPDPRLRFHAKSKGWRTNKWK